MIKRSLSELLRTKRDEELAHRGADVLEKVENALTKDLLSLNTQIRAMDSEIASLMDRISDELKQAKTEAMLVDIEALIKEEELDNQVTLRMMKKFGKLISQMEQVAPITPSPRWGAPLSYEQARDEAKKLLLRIIELGNLETQREFVEIELAKTRRRVNALQKLIIPDLMAKKKVLEEWMEEETREELGRRHWVEGVAGG